MDFVAPLVVFIVLVVGAIVGTIAAVVYGVIVAVMGSQEPETQTASGNEASRGHTEWSPGSRTTWSADSMRPHVAPVAPGRRRVSLVVLGSALVVIVLVVGYVLHRISEADICVGGPCF